MNTKLNNMKINPEYEALFSFESKKEKIEHNAQMISYRILSEVEKICEEKKINKKALAEMVGTSRSYITQLFRGTKQVNTEIMARFEEALDINFQIKVKLTEESEEAYLSRQIPVGFFNTKRLPSHGCVMYYFEGEGKDRTGEIVKRMETENKFLQTA